MARRHVFLGAIAALTMSSMALAEEATDPVFGYWLTEAKTAIVEIGPCGDGGACGEVAWMETPLTEAGAPRTDVENPEESLQSRPLCRLKMIGDFVRDELGAWEDGFIYDATEGDTYDAFMEIQDDGSLKVRGYVGISLIGKSQIWTRVADDRGGC